MKYGTDIQVLEQSVLRSRTHLEARFCFTGAGIYFIDFLQPLIKLLRLLTKTF